MSDLSMSTMTMSSMALDSQLSGAESIKDSTSTVISGANTEGLDSIEQVVAGGQVASRTTEFIGTGADLSSTGTGYDAQQAISNSLSSGAGTIADKII